MTCFIALQMLIRYIAEFEIRQYKGSNFKNNRFETRVSLESTDPAFITETNLGEELGRREIFERALSNP